jgi:hypothetical protein
MGALREELQNQGLDVKLIFDTLKNEVLCFQALAAADFV